MSITSRIDKITKISDEYLGTVLPAPKSVKIELTSRCNYRCGYCAHRLRMKGRGDMDWNFYTRIVREMREAGVEELGVFYIGESFLCDWLPDAIQYAKDVGFPYVFCTTNGSLCTPEFTQSVMEAGLDSLKFSLNYADEEQFEQIANVKPEYFQEALDNVRTTKNVRDFVRRTTGHRCGLYASSIMYDGSQQAKMERMVTENVEPYVDEFYWLPLYSMGSLAVEREKELGFRPTAGNQGRVGALREPLPCWSVFTEGHITREGRLSACCFDAGDKWIMADLNEVSFMDGWNSEAFQTLRAAHLKKDVTGTICEACVAY